MTHARGPGGALLNLWLWNGFAVGTVLVSLGHLTAAAVLWGGLGAFGRLR